MSSKTRADVNAGTLCGSRFVTSPARARMSVPPFFGWLLVGDGPAVVVGAHAAMTVARIRVAADRARFIRDPSPCASGTLAPRFSRRCAASRLLPRIEQAVLRNRGAMPFARRDEDPFARPGLEWSGVELNDQLALEHQKEFVGR